MPRAARQSLPKHEQAVPLVKSIEDEDLDMGMDLEAGEADVEDDETAELDMQDGESEDNAAIEARPSQPNKKTKKKNKRAALMQKLTESSIAVSPYSKSHNKRMKRKSKQSLGLDSMTAALDEAIPQPSTSLSSTSAFATARQPASTAILKNTAPPPESFLAKRSKAENKQLAQKAKTAPNKIGEDTVNKGLTARQRQKMLTQEKERLPAILAHKSFSANPFETIRLHARNTIVPLEKSRRPET